MSGQFLLERPIAKHNKATERSKKNNDITTEQNESDPVNTLIECLDRLGDEYGRNSLLFQQILNLIKDKKHIPISVLKGFMYDLDAQIGMLNYERERLKRDLSMAEGLMILLKEVIPAD